jgi:hypothetical protein
MEPTFYRPRWSKSRLLLIKGSKMNSKPTLETFPELVDLFVMVSLLLGRGVRSLLGFEWN